MTQPAAQGGFEMWTHQRTREELMSPYRQPSADHIRACQAEITRLTKLHEAAKAMATAAKFWGQSIGTPYRYKYLELFEKSRENYIALGGSLDGGERG